MRALALACCMLAGCLPEPPGRCTASAECTEAGTVCGRAGVCVLAPDAGPDLSFDPEIEGAGEFVRGARRIRIHHHPLPAPDSVALLVGAAVLPAPPEDAGHWIVTWDTTALPDGPVQLGARASWGAVEREAAAVLTTTVDNTRPSIVPDLPGAPVPYVAGVTVAVRATVNDSGGGLRVTGRLTPPSDAATEAAMVLQGGKYVAEWPVTDFQLTTGEATFQALVTAVDGAGNSDTVSFPIPVSRLRWKHQLGAGMQVRSVALDGDQVVAGASDGAGALTVALTTRGVRRWSSTGPGGAAEVAVDSTGRTWMVQGNGKVRAVGIDASTDCEMTHATAMVGSPVILEQDPNVWLVTAGADTRLHVTELAASCTRFSSQTFSSFSGSSPAAGPAVLGAFPIFFTTLFGGSTGMLTRQELTASLQTWGGTLSYSSSGAAGSPSLALPLIYLPLGSTVRAIRDDSPIALNWAKTWNTPAATKLESVIDAQRHVYAAVGSTLYALSDAGTEWYRTLAAAISATPALGADGVLYVPTDDGTLYALDAASDTTLWSLRLSTSPLRGAPTIAADRTLYVGADDGFLYAVVTSSPGLDLCDPWPKARRDARNTGQADASVVCP